jgi:hypothetical protein
VCIRRQACESAYKQRVCHTVHGGMCACRRAHACALAPATTHSQTRTTLPYSSLALRTRTCTTRACAHLHAHMRVHACTRVERGARQRQRTQGNGCKQLEATEANSSGGNSTRSRLGQRDKEGPVFRRHVLLTSSGMHARIKPKSTVPGIAKPRTMPPSQPREAHTTRATRAGQRLLRPCRTVPIP